MKIGMLWLDDDQERTLGEKVRRAADYYESKYGQPPNMCYVNHKTLEEEADLGYLRIMPAAHIHQHHFWIGVSVEMVV